MIDLLLVNAPSRLAVYGALAHEFAAIEPPVWAGLIARYCLARGFSVRILDAEAEKLTVEETTSKINALAPRLAVFCIYGQQPSASTQCMPAAVAAAKLVHPRTLTMALGTHPSALPVETLREGPFDYVCAGEGPGSIVALLEIIRDKMLDRQMAYGLWAMEFGLVSTPVGRYENIADLTRDLPGQEWRLLDMKKYRAHNWHLWTGNPRGGYVSVQTSLGCPFKCSFCCINAPFGGPGIRYWSPVNVALQIAEAVHTYGITNIKIPDEMFCLNRKHVLEICDRLISMCLGDRLNMWAYARIDTVKDVEMLDRMRAAGFRWLGIGIESGSQHVRDGVEKSFDTADIEAACERVHRAGLHIAANYIFGLPDDTYETMQQTLDLACSLNTEWANFYCAMAYPGSPLHATARARGWQLPEDEGGPGWIGYAQHAPQAMPLRTDTLTSQEVLGFRDEAFMHYFGRKDYLDMLDEQFGILAADNVEKMLSYGKPVRTHKEL